MGCNPEGFHYADAAVYFPRLHLLLSGNHRRFCYPAVFVLDAVRLDHEQNFPAGCIFNSI